MPLYPLQEREVTKDWEVEILAEAWPNASCASPRVSIQFLPGAHRGHHTARPSVQVRCHARDLQLQVKLFALGWLAQHDDGGAIRNTFIPLAFALAPSEDCTATQLLQQSTHAHLQEACGFTLRDAKASRLRHRPRARIPKLLWNRAAFSQKFAAYQKVHSKGRYQETAEDKLVGYGATLGQLQRFPPQRLLV